MKYKCIKDMYYENEDKGKGFSIGQLYEVIRDGFRKYIRDDSGMNNYITGKQDFLDEYFVEYIEFMVEANPNNDITKKVEEMSYTLGNTTLYVTKESIWGFNDDIETSSLDDYIRLLTMIRDELGEL